MRVRVAGIWKHPNSGIYWFRMAVPERHRASVGQREIKGSLRTRNEIEARLKHAAKLIEVTSLFVRLDGEILIGVDDEAKRICRLGFETLARRNLDKQDDGATILADAHDNVIVAMLMTLAFRVRCSWGEDHRIRAEHHLLGDSDEEQMPAMMAAAITDPGDQDAMVERIDALEGRFVPALDDAGNEMRIMCGNPKTHGMAYRELAAGLLLRRDWKFVELEVMVVAEAAQAPLRIGERIYDALAEQILTKLANYRADKAVVVVSRPTSRCHSQDSIVHSPARVDRVPHTLRDAFGQWCRNRGITLDLDGKPTDPDKTADEWVLACLRM